ncbi:TATA box-binding protein-associated factor RNA polymerase I subunit B isoform X1 [Pocillopora verrucosa]|uniref:TATA box-binding protein-associated factor RNA polymerase I subunit B isoform X1 n=1 Tax=Pocillopora verrucosa TaxID=203993 RepID=UPI00334295FB
MPSCVLCDGEVFDCIDGLYYCQSCGTQSQDMRDEEAANPYEAGVDSRLQVSRKGKGGRQKQFFADKGKPWFMYEAYQYIIRVQVDYLIKLGVNDALKDVVFKLWYKYLQVTEIAFTGSPQGTVPTKGSIFYQRDANLLNRNQRNKSGRKRKLDPSCESDDDDELELCSHFSDEEFYEGDDPSEALPKHDDDADDLNPGDDWTSLCHNKEMDVDDVSDSSEDEFIGSMTCRQTKKRGVLCGHVTLQSTLAFCYLGLLWIDEPVFISDLVRWAKQGQFPYFQTTRHIPGHMKFGSGDFSCLCPVIVPPVSSILRHASRIAKLLQLPCFPEPKLSTYTARFITDLHLPGFLHGVVRKLAEKVKVKTKIHPALQTSIPNLEAGAMAFIVVALKLCYGIDDKTEKDQEEKATSMGSSLNEGTCHTIPLFTDWLKSWKHCEAKKFHNGIPWTDEQFKLVGDPTSYSAFCKSDICGSWEPADRVYTGSQQKNLRANRITNEESQSRYAQLFKSLMTRQRDEDFSSTDTPQVTSFPATCRHVDDPESGTGSCFDKMHSRGINVEFVHGSGSVEGNDLKYICYSADHADQDTYFHSSYKELLGVLADRIEMRPADVQTKVRKLEKALFFKQNLINGVL